MPKTETIYSCKFMQGEAGCSYPGHITPSASTGPVDKRTCLCVETGDIINQGYVGNCRVGRLFIVEKEIPKDKILPESIASSD